MKPTRQLPRLGMRVQISHFSGDVEDGAITAIHDEGRRVVVDCADGPLEFVLSRASAQFLGVEAARDARLHLPASDGARRDGQI